VLKEMLLLKGKWGKPSKKAYQAKAQRLVARLEAAGQAGKASTDADEKRIGRRVLRFRESIPAFLFEKELGGTNNAAERAMIHAVVARKISGGHRAWSGARAWAVLASVCRTARKQGRDVLETMKQLLIDAWAGKPPGLLTPAVETAGGPSP
jgi:transposase